MSTRDNNSPRLTIGGYSVAFDPAEAYGGKKTPGGFVLAGQADLDSRAVMAAFDATATADRKRHDSHKSRELSSRERKLFVEMGSTSGGKPRIYNRKAAIVEARATKLPLSWACALLQQESYGGKNVFGHDPGNDVQGGTVTPERYREYRENLKRGQAAQGVGPTQLTYPPLQDMADALGGCYKVSANMHIGFEYLRTLMKTYGAKKGAMTYNTGGQTSPAGLAYATSLRNFQRKWRIRLRQAVRPH